VEIKKLVINPVLFFILEGYAYISSVIKQTSSWSDQTSTH